MHNLPGTSYRKSGRSRSTPAKLIRGKYHPRRMGRQPVKRPAAFALKLLAACVATLLALEGGVRLLAPVDRFEFIPNTFDPVCQIRQLPHARGFIHCPEYDIEIRTNGGGLREDREDSTGRILCLGDSFTLGFGVDREETFAARLGALNAGVAGTGTAQQLAWFTLDGWRYRPEVVLVAPVVNDLTDNTKSGLFTFALDSTLVQHPAVQSRTLRVLRLLRKLPGYTTWFARSHALNAFKQAFAVRHHGRLEAQAAGDAPPADVQHHEDALQRALLRRLRDECESRGAALVVMPVPARVGSPEQARQDDLYGWLARAGFVTVDLRAGFAPGACRRRGPRLPGRRALDRRGAPPGGDAGAGHGPR